MDVDFDDDMIRKKHVGLDGVGYRELEWSESIRKGYRELEWSESIRKG